MHRFKSRLLSIKGFYKLAAFLAVIFGIISSPVAAQVTFTGFIRNYNAVKHTPGHDILIGRNRLRLNLTKSFSMGEIAISNDLQNLYSEAADSLVYRLREAYVDLYFPESDLRIGKQMLVWGRADGTFITDILTPVDLSDFLTQDFADLRKGVTAINYTRYFGSDFLQLVVNPVFNPNEIPEPESRWFPRQIVPTTINTIYLEEDRRPRLENVQLAGRYGFRSNLNYDLDISVLYWHDPNPSYFKDINLDQQAGLPMPKLLKNMQGSLKGSAQAGSLELTETYTQSFITAYSGSAQLFDKLLLTSESAYYNRRRFDYLSDELRELNFQNPGLAEQLQIAQIFNQNDDGFLKERPSLISMVGLQYELLDITISTQFINEHIFRYDPDILQEQDYYYSTLLLQRSFLRDKWGFRAFGRYNYQGKDFWINPELTYSGIDSFEAAIGSQVFGGKEPDPFYGHLSFKNFAPNSFSYLKISAYF